MIGAIYLAIAVGLVQPSTRALIKLCLLPRPRCFEHRTCLDKTTVVIRGCGLRDDLVKWFGRFGQRAKMCPTRMNGYENDEATEFLRQV